MDVDVSPELDPSERRVLLAALERAQLPRLAADRYGVDWRRAALEEGVARDDSSADYAFSPRNTRGATHA